MLFDHPVTNEVRALAGLDLEGVRAEWRKRYGTPPKIRSVDLLRRNLAWRMQAAVFGGLDEETLAALTSRALGPRLRACSRIVREYRGVKHEVEVVEGGFRYRGERFDSLSAIARHITGTRWNGPQFFGLRPDSKG